MQQIMERASSGDSAMATWLHGMVTNVLLLGALAGG